MRLIQSPRLGVALLSLSALLTGCACEPTVVTETRTVRVEVPAYVALDAELTASVPEPHLPDGRFPNDEVADFIARLKAALRQANDQLGRIRGLQP